MRPVSGMGARRPLQNTISAQRRKRSCLIICGSSAPGNAHLTKADDSTLDPGDRRAVEERARCLLDRAAAWNHFPTPIDDILAAAQVRVALTSLFDPAALLAYLKGKA